MKVRTTITIEEHLKKEVEKLATKERRELSAQLSILLEEALVARMGAAKK